MRPSVEPVPIGAVGQEQPVGKVGFRLGFFR